MSQNEMSGTALCKKLALEFLNQNANKNKKISRKDILKYVNSNWNINGIDEFKSVSGMLSGALYELVNTKKLENPERGMYILNEQIIKNAHELSGAVRQILNKALTDVETLITSINFEPKEDEKPKMNQIYNTVTELSNLKLELMFPSRKWSHLLRV